MSDVGIKNIIKSTPLANVKTGKIEFTRFPFWGNGISENQTTGVSKVDRLFFAHKDPDESTVSCMRN